MQRDEMVRLASLADAVRGSHTKNVDIRQWQEPKHAHLLRSPSAFVDKIIEELCVGCGKCVKGCNMFGNGSLYLQVRHDRCINCNICAISVACPAQAFRQVPADQPYLLRGKGGPA